MILFFLLILHTSVSANECSIYFNEQYTGDAANCSYRGLDAVPLTLPRTIVLLDLKGNHIVNLPNDTFKRYEDLKDLSLAGNRISFLNVKTFSGLQNLETLNLESNLPQLTCDTFPSGVFKPLKQLKTLFLKDSAVSIQQHCPNYIFENMLQLKTLEISTWPEETNRRAFTKLRRLKHLFIIGKTTCNVRLDNKTFAVLANTPLHTLHISCIIQSISYNTFWPLSKLTTLTIDTAFASMTSLSNTTASFAALVGKNMSEIDLTGLQDIRRTDIIDFQLNKRTVSFLLDICVDKLILSNNNIGSLSVDVFSSSSNFTKCIRYLDLSRNPIVGESISVVYLSTLKALQVFDLSYTGRPHNSPVSPKYSNYGIQSLICPPKIEYLFWRNSDLKYSPHDVFWTDCPNLIKLDLANIQVCEIKKLVNFTKLMNIDLTGCTIHESFFTSDFRNTLENLTLQNCIFDFDISSTDNFFSMPNMRNLDLSNIGLGTVTAGTFSRFKNVKTLMLRGNKFDSVPEEMIQMPSVETLDFSSNSLRFIGEKSRSLLDAVADSRQIHLYLEGNLFSCSCDTLGFLQWLQETRVMLDKKGNYSCVIKDGSLSNTFTFYQMRIQHWRTCIGLTLLFWVNILSFSFLLCIFGTLLIQRYYRNIEQYVLHLLGMTIIWHPKRQDYTYAVYIAYADQDYQWPCHDLRNMLQEVDNTIELYVPDLHEPLGMSKAEAIVEALSNSWKIVVVVSANAFTDGWSHFTVQSAIRIFSEYNIISNRIIVIYKDASAESKARVPPSLLEVVSHGYDLEFDDTVEFWLDLYRLVVSDDVTDYKHIN